MRTRSGYGFAVAKASLTSLAAAFLVCTWHPAAHAQGGPGGGPGPMPQEKRDAAIELEAKGVAKELALSDENSAKLVEAYKGARKSLEEGSDKIEGRGLERFQEMLKLGDAEREKFKTALSAFLNEEQTGKAVSTLGTFSRQWDRLVDTLAGYGLEEEKLYKGLGLISGYIVESDAAFKKAREAGDMELVRDAMRTLKERLDTGMAEVLSEEQLAKWKEDTTFRGGGRGFGGGGGGGGGGNRGEGGSEPPAGTPPPPAGGN